jgi:hypothetical protein
MSCWAQASASLKGLISLRFRPAKVLNGDSALREPF